MIRRILVLVLGLVAPAPAGADPGDFLLVHGSLVDRGTGVIVLRADNGKIYYVTAGSSDHATLSRLRAGETVTIRGTEGAYPNEIRAEGIDPDEARRTAWRSRSTASAGRMLAYKDWRLPAGNRYEIYNPSSGTYTQVDIASVPGRLDAGEVLYDRTSDLWVQHPSVGGRNPAYLEGGAAVTGGIPGHGDWRLPRRNRYETYEAATGHYAVVDWASVPARLDRGELIYDRTAELWVQHPSVGGRNPAYLERSAPSPYRSARLQGHVQSIEGHTLTIVGGDGTIVTVDTSRLKPETVRTLRWGQPVEVRGVFDAGRTRFRASDVEAGD